MKKLFLLFSLCTFLIWKCDRHDFCSGLLKITALNGDAVPSLVMLKAGGDEVVINVTCPIAWRLHHANKLPDWLTVTPDRGYCSEIVTIKSDGSEPDDFTEYTLVFIAVNGERVKLTLKQEEAVSTNVEMTNVCLQNASGASIDTPMGSLNSWTGQWLQTQLTDLVTSANGLADGFFITGTLYDPSGIVSAWAKFSYGGEHLTFNMLTPQSFFTYNVTTYKCSFNVRAALSVMGFGTAAGVSEGTYKLSVWGTNNSGNVTVESDPQIITIVVDHTPPFAPTSITIADVSGTSASGAMILQTNAPTVTIHLSTAAAVGDFIQLWQKAPDENDDEGLCLGTIQLSLTNITAGSIDFTNLNLVNGEYILYARSLDLAGNTTNTTVSERVLVVI
jgi:hypothetical protein